MVQINQQIYDSYIKYIQTAQNGSRTEGATSTENGTKLTFDYDVLQELMADEGSEAVLLILEQLKAQGENVEGPTMQGNTITFKVNGDSYELHIAEDESPAAAKPASPISTTVINGYEYTDEELAFLESLPKDLFTSCSYTNDFIISKLSHMLSEDAYDKFMTYFGYEKDSDWGILLKQGKFSSTVGSTCANGCAYSINGFSNVYTTNLNTNQVNATENSVVENIRSVLYQRRFKSDYREALATIFKNNNIEYKITQEATAENGYVCTVEFSVDGVKYSMSAEPNRVASLSDTDYLNQLLFGGELTPESNMDYEVLINQGGFLPPTESFQSYDEYKDFLEYYKKKYMPDANINLIETRSGAVLYVKDGDKTSMYKLGAVREYGGFDIWQKEYEHYDWYYDTYESSKDRSSWIYSMSYYSKDYCDLDENLLDFVDPSTGKSIADIVAENACKDGNKFRNSGKSDSIMETNTAYDIVSILVKNGVDYKISYTDDKAKAIITIEYQGKTSQIIVDNNNDVTDWHQMDYIAALKGEAAQYAEQNLTDITPDESETLGRDDYIKCNPCGFDLDENGNIDIEKLAAQLEKNFPTTFHDIVNGQDLAAIFGYGIYNREKHQYDIPDKDTIKNAIVAYMQKCGIEADKNGNYSVTDFYNAICDQENSCSSYESQSVSGRIDTALERYNYRKKFGFDKYKGVNSRDWPEELVILDTAFGAVVRSFGYDDGNAGAAVWPDCMIFYMETGVTKMMSEPEAYSKNYINATLAAILKLAGYDPEAVDNIDWDNLKDSGIYEQLGTEQGELYNKILAVVKKMDPELGSLNWCSAYDMMEYLSKNGYGANYYNEFINSHSLVKTLQKEAIDVIGSAYTPEDQVKEEEAEETVTETVTSYVAENIETQDNMTVTQDEIDEVFGEALDEQIRATVEAALNTIDNLGIVDGKTAEDIVNEKIAEIKQRVEIIAALFSATKELENHPRYGKYEFIVFWENEVVKRFRDKMADKYPEDYKYYRSILDMMFEYLRSRIGDAKTMSNIDIREFLQIYLQHYDEIAEFYSQDDWGFKLQSDTYLNLSRWFE